MLDASTKIIGDFVREIDHQTHWTTCCKYQPTHRSQWHVYHLATKKQPEHPNPHCDLHVSSLSSDIEGLARPPINPSIRELSCMHYRLHWSRDAKALILANFLARTTQNGLDYLLDIQNHGACDCTCILLEHSMQLCKETSQSCARVDANSMVLYLWRSTSGGRAIPVRCQPHRDFAMLLSDKDVAGFQEHPPMRHSALRSLQHHLCACVQWPRLLHLVRVPRGMLICFCFS